MHQTIGAYDTKTKLAEMLRRVEEGESFTITKRGKPIADVIPNCDQEAAELDADIDRILAASKPVMSDADLKAAIELGRK